MNPEDYSRDDLITALGPVAATSIALLAFLLWLATLSLRHRIPSILWHFIGALLATTCLWAAFQMMAQTLSLATSWPLIAIAIAGGIATEWIVGLYGFEKTLVSSGRGRILLALRLGTLAIILLILVQPVRSFLETREIDREIAILIDDSDSMLLADQRLNATERFDRAALSSNAELSDRPPLHQVSQLVQNIDDQLAEEQQAFSSAPSHEAALESRETQITPLLQSMVQSNNQLTSLLQETKEKPFPKDVKDRLEDYFKRSRDGLGRILTQALTAVTDRNANELLKQIGVARNELEGITSTIAVTTFKADDYYYNSLSKEEQQQVDASANSTRLELARKVLQSAVSMNSQQGIATDQTLLDSLKDLYNLRFYRYAQEVTQIPDITTDESWTGKLNTDPARTQTDLTLALEHVLNNTAAESLAGVLLLSDGRHNGGDLPEDSLRQLAVQNTPLSAVPLGGKLGPVDLSILELKSPESIYLDDRVVVAAEVKADGLLGKTIEAELLSNGEVVDTLQVEVSDVSFRTELRFVHRPEEKGIIDYQIHLKPDDEEIFRNNNSWDFKVAVTDDRTNVLLVDGYPRWEFRYLRNLFYGRDKSVHLQYVLLNPDEIYRSNEAEQIPASASRPFGEAEATELPNSPTEWQLFDVIILGDIGTDALSNSDWEAINEAVTRHGALLVCVSGARHMPHGHTNSTLRDLLPITYTPDSEGRFESPESAFKIELTASGQSHPVTSQSASRALNLDRWASFQPMQWRFVADEIKPNAEVLAYARPVGTRSISSSSAPDGSPGSVEAAIEQLANRKTLERKNALISTARAGLGKVLFLHADQTWRFRYGVGDTYHHRFWGQVTRWGAGPNLRSGNEFVRLGTDRLSYTPDDPVMVTAKVLDKDRRPVTDAILDLEVWHAGEMLSRQQMSYRSDSSGLYETSLSGLAQEGGYELRVTGDAADQAIEQNPEGPQGISTELLVVTTRNPVELAELTADRDFLNRATQMTGGHLAELSDLDSLITSFGAPKETITEQRNLPLWDTWPMLLTFLGFLTTEWVLRRRSGLV